MRFAALITNIQIYNVDGTVNVHVHVHVLVDVHAYYTRDEFADFHDGHRGEEVHPDNMFRTATRGGSG